MLQATRTNCNCNTKLCSCREKWFPAKAHTLCRSALWLYGDLYVSLLSRTDPNRSLNSFRVAKRNVLTRSALGTLWNGIQTASPVFRCCPLAELLATERQVRIHSVTKPRWDQNAGRGIRAAHRLQWVNWPKRQLLVSHMLPAFVCVHWKEKKTQWKWYIYKRILQY